MMASLMVAFDTESKLNSKQIIETICGNCAGFFPAFLFQGSYLNIFLCCFRSRSPAQSYQLWKWNAYYWRNTAFSKFWTSPNSLAFIQNSKWCKHHSIHLILFTLWPCDERPSLCVEPKAAFVTHHAAAVTYCLLRFSMFGRWQASEAVWTWGRAGGAQVCRSPLGFHMQKLETVKWFKIPDFSNGVM